MRNPSHTPSAPGPTGPPVLRLLGPIDLTGSIRPLTPQQLSMVAYLACVGPARPEALADALWDGAPVSERRLVNLVSAVRAALGRHHLPEARAGRYRLVGVVSDLDLLIQLTAPQRPDHPDRPDHDVAALEAGLALVRGPALGRPRRRYWCWLDDHPEVAARAEAAVGERALRLVAVLRQRGQLERARTVCERMLGHQPLDRDLTLALESLHRQEGRPAAAHRLVNGWRERVTGLTGQDPLVDRDQASTGSAVTTTLPW